MSVRYQEVQWSKEPVSIEKLQTMVDNTESLRLSRPETVIRTGDGAFTKNQGIKILYGSAVVAPPRSRQIYVDVQFGNYFSVGCRPIIVPSVNTFHKKRINMTFASLKRGTVPDHEGFKAYCWADDPSGGHLLTNTFYITYTAGGW